MHELSIAESLIDALRQELRQHPAVTARRVRVRVGVLRLVVPETLQVCFAAATRDTPLAGVALEIEAVPATAQCASCGTGFAVAEQWFECPGCGTFGAALRTGRELELASIELDETEPAAVMNSPWPRTRKSRWLGCLRRLLCARGTGATARE